MTDPVRLLERLSEVTAPPRAEFRASLHELLVAEVGPRRASVHDLRRRRTAVVAVAACLAVLALLVMRSPAADPNGLEVVDAPSTATETPTPAPAASSATDRDDSADGRAPRTPNPGVVGSQRATRSVAGPGPDQVAARTAPPQSRASAVPLPDSPGLAWRPGRHVFSDEAHDAYPPFGAPKRPNSQLSNPAYDIRSVSITGLERGSFRIAMTLGGPPVEDNSTYWVAGYLNADQSCYAYHYLSLGRADLRYNVYCYDGAVETRYGTHYIPGTVERRGNTLVATFTPLHAPQPPEPYLDSDTFHGFLSRACPGGTSCTNANNFDEAASSGAVLRWR